MPGDVQIYYSIDKANTDDVASSHEEFLYKYLQSISLSSLPSAELKLKVGALIILLQNLYLQESLYNSTRLVITYLYRYLIQGQILTSIWAGTVYLILQIDLSSAEEKCHGIFAGLCPVRLFAPIFLIRFS
jgi:hypothetical protein